MLARWQRLVLAGWLLAILGWSAWFVSHDRPVLACAGAVFLAGLHAWALGLEYVLLPWVNAKDPAPRPSAARRFSAWWNEVLVAAVVFGWRQPFRADKEPDHLAADAKGRDGVLLVHGFVCNRGVWLPWMRRLRELGVPFVAVNLEPVLASIDAYVPAIEAAVRRLERCTGRPPVVVAHSMGGLAVRAWLTAHGADHRVRHVVTIGSPHHGTWLARFGLVHNAREMRQGGKWLSALAASEPAARRARFTCFYSHCDNIVMPASTATLPGAHNRHLAGQAHVQMVYHDDVFSETVGRLSMFPNEASGAPAR
jgi:triacylglycerol esterase/lipase EstA (alpha/beta hydrolase family)